MRKRLNEELGRKTAEEFAASEKMPLVLVLDNVRSHNNVGSVFRTADAFLIEKIILCGITATPPHRDIQKTALGATESVKWEYITETVDAVKKLKTEGYKVIAVEQVDGSCELQDLVLSGKEKDAVIFGHEM